MATTLITDIHELDSAIKTAVKTAIRELEMEKSNQVDKLYTINQLAKMWKKNHSTVKKMVLAGILKTTANGLVSESSVKEYLHNS